MKCLTYFCKYSKIMKTILIDLYKTKNPYNGLGVFSTEFASNLSKNIPQNLEINFLVPSKKIIKNISNVNYISTNLIKRYLPQTNKTYNLWHSLYQCPTFYPNKKTPQIVTIHDLNFLIEKPKNKTLIYLNSLQKCVDRADILVAISHYTKTLLEANINLKNKSIQVIYDGVQLKEFPKAIELSNIFGKYLFSIGEFSNKKNFHTIINMMEYLPDFTLIIAGNNQTNYGIKIKKLLSSIRFPNKIILLGKINEETKTNLFKNCTAFLFPSIAEGFGIPPIEAMLAGKPVFLSTHCSLPEIGGEQAFYFNSFEPKEMADTILNGLNKIAPNLPEFENQSIQYAQKYSWQNCIQSYIKLYNSILN